MTDEDERVRAVLQERAETVAVTGYAMFRQLAEQGFDVFKGGDDTLELELVFMGVIYDNRTHMDFPAPGLSDALATLIARDCGLSEAKRVALAHTLQAFAQTVHAAEELQATKEFWSDMLDVDVRDV